MSSRRRGRLIGHGRRVRRLTRSIRVQADVAADVEIPDLPAKEDRVGTVVSGLLPEIVGRLRFAGYPDGILDRVDLPHELAGSLDPLGIVGQLDVVLALSLSRLLSLVRF